ncbi:MAG: hypothetical protein V4670_09125 [Bacteroidota bacterium]
MKNYFLLLVAFFAMSSTYAQATLSSITPIPYEIVENQPLYPGGINEFMKFVGKNFHTPDDENFPGGILKVTFVIETNGSINEVKIINDLGFNTGEEIKRILSLCPKWTPGDQAGKPARVIYTLPVNIRI